MKKRILTLVLVLLGLTAAAQAVTYDASGSTDNASSVAFNCAGSSNTILVVGVYTDGAIIGSPAVASYNGTLMNEAVANGSAYRSMYLFYLLNPSSGSNTIKVTFSSVPTDYHVTYASYDGVSAIGNVDSAVPAMNLPMTYGSMANGSLGIYLAAATGTAPALSTPTAMTERVNLTYTASVYTFGDVTVTSALTFVGSDRVTYQLTGAMVELLPLSTPTPTWTPTPTPSASPTATPTPSASPTLTFTVTKTASPTLTFTISPTPTPTWTPTKTATPTATPTATQTASPTPTTISTTTPAPPRFESLGRQVAPVALGSCADFNLLPSTSWTVAISPTCKALPCQAQVFVKTTAATTYTYWISSASTTPTVNGIDLAPGQTSGVIPMRTSDYLWQKASVATSVSATGRICQ